MIFQNAELYNIAELVENPSGSKRMCRFPENLRLQLNEYAQRNSICVCGAEVRFVINSGKAVIRFDGEIKGAELYFGCFQSGSINAEDGIVTVEMPENIQLLERLGKDYNLPFSTRVVRIIMPYGAGASIISAEGDIRPPKKEETPAKKLLIYGSSITHGWNAMHTAGTYAMRTAMQLGVDLINLGIAGGAMMERCMADYISSRTDFDYAVLEMGINYQWDSEKGCFRSVESYAELIDYFVEKIASEHKDKWIFANAFYPCESDFYYKPDAVAAAYRDALKAKVDSLNLPKLVYLDGSKMMPCGVIGLSADLTHPSAEGAKNIADCLAKTIIEYIG